MLGQLGNLHHHHLVYKYLTPKDVIVTHGLHIDETVIRLRISHIAMMQLIDVPVNLTLDDKMCGTNRVYVAPEVLHEQ